MPLCALPTLAAALALPADAASLRALAVGVALRFLEQRHGAAIGPHVGRVLAAIRCGQYQIFFDRYARPVAYVSWAFVDRSVDRALQRGGPAALDDEPWQGGTEAWVIDCFAHEGSLPGVLAFLRDHAFADREAVSYFRFRAGRRLVKQLTRGDRTGFARGRWNAPDADARPVDNPALLHPLWEVLSARQAVGRIVEALPRGARRSPLWQEPGRLSALLTQRQARSYLRADGEVGGVLTWAWLSERTVRRLRSVPMEQLHRSEWNEGTRLCIWELICTDEVLPEVLRDLEGALFPDEAELLLYMPARSGRLQSVRRGTASQALHGWCAAAAAAVADPALEERA